MHDRYLSLPIFTLSVYLRPNYFHEFFMNFFQDSLLHAYSFNEALDPHSDSRALALQDSCPKSQLPYNYRNIGFQYNSHILPYQKSLIEGRKSMVWLSPAFT